LRGLTCYIKNTLTDEDVFALLIASLVFKTKRKQRRCYCYFQNLQTIKTMLENILSTFVKAITEKTGS